MASERHNLIEDESKTYSVALLRYGVLPWKQVSDMFRVFKGIEYLILKIQFTYEHIFQRLKKIR